MSKEKKETPRLLNEGQSLPLKTENELRHVAHFLKENTLRLEVIKNYVQFYGVSYHPLTVPMALKEPKVRARGAYVITLPPIDPEDRDVAECVRFGTGLFLVTPSDRSRMDVFPTGETAFFGIMQQAGDDGSVIKRRGEVVKRLPGGAYEKEYRTRGSRQALSIERKAERFTEDFSLCGETCQILIWDGKVRAVLSGKYRYVPAEELIEALRLWLSLEFPDHEYVDGQVSHEYLWCRYDLNTPEFEGTVKGLLNDAGYGAENVRAGVRFSTSDVGLGSIRTSVSVTVDGIEMPLGKGVERSHLGDTSSEKYAEDLKKIGALLKDCDQRIEQLAFMTVKNPSKVLLEIYKRDRRGIFSGMGGALNAAAVKLAEERPKGGTGIDVYMGFNKALASYRKNAQVSPRRYLEISEHIAGTVLYLPFDVIDREIEE